MKLMGIDPGLGTTGWGLIEAESGRLLHLANGTVSSSPKAPLAERLLELFDGLRAVFDDWTPEVAAVEETFVNRNPASALKLGQARGIALLVPTLRGVPVAEYAPNSVKKSVTGVGHAGKEQVQAMVQMLLPGVKINGADAADALAIAICHAHHAETSANIHGATLAGAKA